MHRNKILTQAGIICIMAMLATASVINAATDKTEAEKTLSTLLFAIKANEYASFVSDGTPAFKAGITKQMFEGVSAQMIPRMKTGYEVQYLGSLKQQGMDVFLWKITYKDGGNDTLAKLALQDGKIAGFLLQ
jgi:hypothetical protein